MEGQNNTIDPKLRVFLMAVRAGLLAICKAIERFVGIEEKCK
jgi:hypothetical protein